MRPSSFFIDTRKLFPQRSWHWMIVALHQDPVVFNKLTTSNFGNKSLASLPAVPELWTPAALSNYALGNPVEIGKFRNKPLQPLSENLRVKVTRAYENWYRKNNKYQTFEDAGLVALSIRERLRIKGSWEGFAEEIRDHLDTSKTVIACLYGMIPEPNDFLEALISHDDYSQYSNLVIHAILSNPIPPEQQITILKSILSGKDLPLILSILEDLELNRPSLAKTLAKDIINDFPLNEYIESEDKRISNLSIREFDSYGDRIARLTRLLRYLTLQDYADKSDEITASLTESIEITSSLQAQFHAKLAQNFSNNQKELHSFDDQLKVWKKANQIAPDEPKYVVGLANALLASGRLEDARAYLEARQVDPGLPLDPLLLLTSAEVAYQQNDIVSAKQKVYSALEHLGDGDNLLGGDFLRLAELLSDLELNEDAEAVLRSGFSKFPNYPQLLAPLAQLQLQVGKLDEALEKSYLALALEGVSSLGSSQASTEQNIRELLINSLETYGEWAPALDERVALVEMKRNQTTKDLHELANCALKGKVPQLAINVSRQAIDLDDQDGIAYTLLGKGLLDSGEVSPALDNLKKATQLSPNSTAVWINLSEAYKFNGDESLFFDTLNAAVHAVPEAPEIHYSLGVEYISQNSLTRALDSLSKAITLLASDSPDTKPDIGKHYFIDKQIFIENPDLAIGISLNTGNTLKELGYLDDAKIVLGNAHDVGTKLFGVQTVDSEFVQLKDKRLVEIANSYGQLLMEFGEHEKAINILELVVSHNKNAVQPKLDLAKSLLLAHPSTENAEKAVDLLIGAFGSNPSDNFDTRDSNPIITDGYPNVNEEEKAEAQALFAEALALSGDFEKARDVFRKALDAPVSEKPQWKARMSIGLGRVALVLDEPELALAALQEAAQIQNNDPMLYRLLSEAYLKTNLLEDSYKVSKKVLEYSSRNSDDMGWFTNHLSSIVEISGTERKNLILDAITILESAILENPENRFLLFQLAKLQIIFGKREEGIATIESITSQSIGINEVDHHEVLELVLQLKNLGETEIARDLLQSMIDQGISNGSINTNRERKIISMLLIELSDIYFSTGDQISAIQYLDHALDLDPENPEIYRKKAAGLNEEGKFEDAEPFIQEAIKKFPKDISLVHEAGKLYYYSGKLYRALEYYDSIFSTLEEAEGQPKQNYIYLQASEIAAAALLPDRALEYLKKINVETLDQQFIAYCMIAELELTEGNEKDAVDAIEKAQSQFSDHPRITAVSARVSAKYDSLTAGQEILSEFFKEKTIDEIIEQDQGDTHHLLNPFALNRFLGEACLEIGDWNKAVELFIELVNKAPQEPNSHLLLATAIIRRAEAQRLCQVLNVRNHAPGDIALDVSSFDMFERSINDVVQRIKTKIQFDSNENSNLEIKGSLEYVKKWQTRGYSAFESSVERLNEFAQYVFTGENTPDEVAAYLLALSQIDQRKPQQEMPLKELLTRIENWGLYDSPIILAMLSLLFSRGDGVEALEFGLRSEEITANEIELLPMRFPMLQFLISTHAINHKELSIALQSIQEALDDWPDEPYWNELASKIFRSDDQMNGLPDLNQAASYLNKAIQLEPKQLSFYLDRGYINMQNGDFDSAVEILENASQINPGDGEIWLVLAEAQMHAGMIENAAFSTAKAIEYSDDPVKPLLLRGEIDLQNNNPKGAYAIAEQLLEKLPDHVDALLMLSKALVLLDRSGDALKLLKESIREVDDPLPVQLEYVRLSAESKGINSAIPEINRIQSDHPNHPKVLAVLADIQRESGQENKALDTAIKALKFDEGELSQEEKAKLHLLMGCHYHEDGQLDQAIHHLIYAERLNPKNVDILQELGKVYHKRRQHEEAKKYYQDAIEISPGNYYSYYLAGSLLKDMKDYAGAENSLRKASHLEPDDMDVKRLLRAVSALNLIHNQRLVVNEMPTPL